MPRTHPINSLDRPRVLSYGIRELRELSKLMGKDLLIRGEHWISALSDQNICQVAAIMLRRDDPTVTAEIIENCLDEDPDRKIADLGNCIVAVMGYDAVESQTEADPQTPITSETSGGLGSKSTEG